MKFPLNYDWTAVETKPGIAYRCPEAISSHLRSHWDGPAVYRWLVFNASPGDPCWLYIGETDLLARRVYHYLHPGPSQRTNLRLKSLFTAELENGRRVSLEVLRFSPFEFEGVSVTMEALPDKRVRRLLENLFVWYYSREGLQVRNA